MKLYTRTGDDGKTGLFSGDRVGKDHPRIEAYGTVDELNACLGLAASSLSADVEFQRVLGQDIVELQSRCFDLGADLATPATEDDDFAPSEMVLRMVAAQTEWLEQAIDAANANLEPLTSFVLPGGSEASARLHVARAATRRAERAMTAMAEQLRTNPQALAYINRLSDYLFVLARTANDGGRSDIKWVPGANR